MIFLIEDMEENILKIFNRLVSAQNSMIWQRDFEILALLAKSIP